MTHWSRTTTQGESGIEFYLTATEGSTKSVTHLPNHRSLFKLMKLHTSGLAIARHSGEFSSSASFSFPINKFRKILHYPLLALRALYSLNSSRAYTSKLPSPVTKCSNKPSRKAKPIFFFSFPLLLSPTTFT